MALREDTSTVVPHLAHQCLSSVARCPQFGQIFASRLGFGLGLMWVGAGDVAICMPLLYRPKRHLSPAMANNPLLVREFIIKIIHRVIF
jgi:hypothetical protein